MRCSFLNLLYFHKAQDIHTKKIKVLNICELIWFMYSQLVSSHWTISTKIRLRWWLRPFIPALRRQSQADLHVPNMSGLQNPGLSVLYKHCIKQNKKKNPKTNREPHYNKTNKHKKWTRFTFPQNELKIIMTWILPVMFGMNFCLEQSHIQKNELDET